jgi:hypothetical protein
MKPTHHNACHREVRAGGPRRSIWLSSIFLGLLASVLGPLPLFAQPATGASAAEIKRITDRYALTRNRIAALLEQRLRPTALPANPPNPFYQSPREAQALEGPPGQDPAEVIVPEAADISDIDTLRKYSTALKIGGLITRNGVPHLTINNTACKVGDIITVGNRDNPTYLKLLSLSPAEFTLGLNDATLAVPIRK